MRVFFFFFWNLISSLFIIDISTSSFWLYLWGYFSSYFVKDSFFDILSINLGRNLMSLLHLWRNSPYYMLYLISNPLMRRDKFCVLFSQNSALWWRVERLQHGQKPEWTYMEIIRDTFVLRIFPLLIFCLDLLSVFAYGHKAEEVCLLPRWDTFPGWQASFTRIKGLR